MINFIITFTYIVITIVCVGISTFSTYHGFTDMLRPWFVAGAVTLVISTGLFACDLLLLDRRKHGESILGVVFVLFIFMVASFASNFNAFYTSHMRQGVIDMRFEKASKTFDNNMRKAETAVRRISTLVPLKEKIGQLLINLDDEVKDPGNGGMGPIARGIVQKVHDTMPVKFQIPKLTVKDTKGLVAEIKRRVNTAMLAYEEKDRGMMTLNSIRQKQAAKRNLARSMQNEEAGIASVADYLTQISPNQKQKIAAIETWGGQSKDIASKVTQVYAEQSKETSLKLAPIFVGSILLGNIPHSFRSGFIERPNLGATVQATAMAFLIDIIPLLMALFMFHKIEEGSRITGKKSKKARKSPFPTPLSR